jgi:hypothetical protein
VVDAEPRAPAVDVAQAEGDLVTGEHHPVDLLSEVDVDVVGEPVVEPPRA